MEHTSYTIYTVYGQLGNSPEDVQSTTLPRLRVSRFQDIKHALAYFCAINIQYFTQSTAVSDNSHEHLKGVQLYKMTGNAYDLLPTLEVFNVKPNRKRSDFPFGMYYLSGRKLGKLIEESNFPLDKCTHFDPKSIIMRVGKYNDQNSDIITDKGWQNLHDYAVDYLNELNQQTPIFKIAKYSEAFGQTVYPGWNYTGWFTEEYFHYSRESVTRHLSSTDLMPLDGNLLQKASIKEKINFISVTDHYGTECLRLQSDQCAGINLHAAKLTGTRLPINNRSILQLTDNNYKSTKRR